MTAVRSLQDLETAHEHAAAEIVTAATIEVQVLVDVGDRKVNLATPTQSRRLPSSLLRFKGIVHREPINRRVER
jgi:hypothetical protein